MPVKQPRSNRRKRATGAILVRVLPEERAEVEELSRAAGLSMASFLRASALGTPGPRARRAPTFEAEALARAIAALNKAGTDLHRIAEVLMAGGNTMATDCFAALAEARAAAAAIREAVGRKDDRKGQHA